MNFISELNTLEPEVVTLSFVECSSPKTDIVIRLGEYPHKPGKRLSLDSNNYDFNNLEISYDSVRNSYYISEYSFNKKLGTALYNYLKDKNINAVLQDTSSKYEDLNSAGRKAKQHNPKIYLSIHTNSYDNSSTGYLFLTNNDELSKKMARRLSDALKDNGSIPQRYNQINSGYIGELNEKPGTINILAELGFFSNFKEAQVLSSDAYVEYVASHLGDEIISILETLK